MPNAQNEGCLSGLTPTHEKRNYLYAETAVFDNLDPHGFMGTRTTKFSFLPIKRPF